MNKAEIETIFLKILLPSDVFLSRDDVKKLIFETPQGYFGILSHRLDCVTPLVPGILSYDTIKEGTSYVAVDRGILIKKKGDVLIVVRNAKTGVDLGSLHKIILEEFITESEKDKNIRIALAKLENDFVRCYLELKERG